MAYLLAQHCMRGEDQSEGISYSVLLTWVVRFCSDDYRYISNREEAGSDDQSEKAYLAR